MNKYFIIILSVILKIFAFDFKSNDNTISFENIGIQHQEERDLSYIVEHEDMLDTRKEGNDYCDINIVLSKNNDKIYRFDYMITYEIGNFDFDYSASTFSFLNSNSLNFNVLYRPLSYGNNHLKLIIIPYALVDGNEVQLDSLDINFYCVKESTYFCSSIVSLTSARYSSFCFLLEDGLIDEESYENYVYQEENNYYVSVSTISESNKSIIEGYFNIEVQNGELYPAEGIKVRLNIYQKPSTIYSQETYIDFTGKYTFEITQNQFSKIELIILSETKYVSIGSEESQILNTIYNYSLNLTNSISNSLGKKYIIHNMRSFFSNDRGKAMAQAVLMNAAGDCIKDWKGEALPKIPIAFPVTGAYFSVSNDSQAHICLSEFGQEGGLHEYGHYLMYELNISPQNAGGNHSSRDDLALRYSNQSGKGYRMAISEGFATFFSNLVQSKVDYSHFKSTWKQEYTEFQTMNPNSTYMILRESNEHTVTNILLSIVDPEFKYSDAIGIVNFFRILKTFNPNPNSTILNDENRIVYLNQLLDRLSDIPILNDTLINKALDFYHIAPYGGTITFDEQIHTENSPIVYEEHIPTFTWYKGSYVCYDEYLTYKNDGYGSRYTEAEALINPSVKLTNFGLSNDNFTFYLCNGNGAVLLEKENLVDTYLSGETTSYTPTKQEWESIFFTNVFDCYWYVEAYDTNNLYNNGSYKYKSEKYPFILEKLYVEQAPVQSTSGISNLTLRLDLEEIYTVESTRRFKINIGYIWTSIPSERLQDFIIMKWSTIYQLNGVMYAVDYYNDGQIYVTHSSSEFTYSETSNPLNQMYWVANLIYRTPQNEFPSLLYGQAEIELISPVNATNLLIQIQYHHVTNTAIGMAGVYINENGDYVTNAYQIESIHKIYSV